MRTLCRALAVLGLVAALLTIGSGSPAQAGDSVTITVEKVIVGTPPDGAEFVVAFPCGQAGVNEFTFTPTMLGQQSTFALLGPCTVTETEDGGADSVSYACSASGPGVDSCVATTTGVDIEFVGSNGGGEAVITVTNTFADPEPPAVDPAEGAAGDVVEATPSFTG